MKTGSVELKLRNGTAIKIKGSPDLWPRFRKLILEVSKERASDQVEEGEPKESSRAGKLAHVDSVENRELEAGHSSRSQSGWMNQRVCWSLKEAAERCGVSYHTLYRAACRGDLKIIKIFGRMMVSESELPRFVGERDRIFAEETKKVKRRPN
jgi:Helix-turn-helix domain